MGYRIIFVTIVIVITILLGHLAYQRLATLAIQ